MAYFKGSSTRIKSIDVANDNVSRHMRAWKLYQHELKIKQAKPWETCHVNPGRKHNSSNNKEHQQSLIPTRSFSRLSLQPPNKSYSTSPTSFRSLQPGHKKSLKISYTAHSESHKKFDNNEKISFTPKILDTSATSRLIQSRNYQPPKRKTAQKKRNVSAGSSKTMEKSQEINSNNKTWSRRRSESSCSSSTICDSAYEAGGSIEGFSPHSRGSTPEPLHDEDLAKEGTNNVKETLPLINESDEAIAELIERPHTPMDLLDRNESLDYILLEHDLMNEIVTSGVLTNTSVKEVCCSYIEKNSKHLDDSKVNKIVEKVYNLLGIPEGDTLDYTDFGLCTKLS